MMRQHPVEDGPLQMPGTIDSRHSGREASRNEPTSLPQKKEARLERAVLGGKRLLYRGS